MGGELRLEEYAYSFADAEKIKRITKPNNN
jgi:hypothetical protein